MRNNLIKILAVSTIALTLGACKGGKKETPATEVTIQEALEMEGGNWKLAGQKIKVSNLALSARYGNHFWGAYVPKTDSDSLMYIEAEVKDVPTFTTNENGYGADITLEGVLADVNGRPVLTDAVCTINSEREKGKQASEGHGASVYGYQSFNRSAFDQTMDRTSSGMLLFDLTMQLASLPEDDTFSKQQFFYVTFPGENLDLEDEENYSPIPVVIPEGLAETTIKNLKTFFSGKAVADFISFDTLVCYYDSKVGGAAVLVEDYWGSRIAKPDKNPEVYNSGADVKAAYDPKFAHPLANEFFNDEAVFSYVPVSFVSAKDQRLVKDTYVFIKDKANSLVLELAMNVKGVEKLNELLEGIANYLDDESNGWVKKENGLYTYSDEPDTLTREIILMVDENNPSYLSFYYFDLKASS